MIKFKRLEEIAKALKPIHQSGKSFHVTVIFKKNKLLCIANNNYKKLHPWHKFGRYLPTKSEGVYTSGIHSECAALIKLGRMECDDLTFVNLRIDNNGEPAMSKPCKNCHRVLEQVGYKQLWYYNGNDYVKL
tara:strand:- start:1208 stop:1603 length:396 start_codon:yes stop_codon:yes gene_type:complete